MPPSVVANTTLSCTMGAAPSVLQVLPVNRVQIQGAPAATIMDSKPFLNIVPFGLCRSQLNPATAALTAAALGTPTPGPCTPNTPAPWMPGAPTTLIGGMPALTSGSTCVCAAGGVISVVMTPALQTQIG